MNKEYEEAMKKLARSFALLTVRNSFIEELHTGITPSSEAGDYSDVKVVTPNGEIPWNEIARISDEEMKTLMKQVTNKLYTCLYHMMSMKQREAFDHLVQTGNRHSTGWDDPEFDEALLSIIQSHQPET